MSKFIKTIVGAVLIFSSINCAFATDSLTILNERAIIITRQYFPKNKAYVISLIANLIAREITHITLS